MSLLGFVTGAASLFGGGGGGSSQTGNSSTSMNQDQASKASEAKTGTASSSASSSGTSNTSGSTSQTGTTSGNEASTTTGTTTNYSSQVLASLDAILSQQLGDGTAGTGNVSGVNSALQERLKQVQELAAKPAFDIEGYVGGITQAAQVASQSELDSRINGMLSSTGASEGGNSMAALLGNKLRNETAASLAGVKANATAQGQQIQQAEQANLTTQISGLSSDIMGNLNSLLAAAKGGTQTSTGAANTVSNQTQQQSGTQQSQTTEQLQQNATQTETSNTVQQGTTSTTGASNTNSSSSTKPSNNLFDNVLKAFTQSSAAA